MKVRNRAAGIPTEPRVIAQNRPKLWQDLMIQHSGPNSHARRLASRTTAFIETIGLFCEGFVHADEGIETVDEAAEQGRLEKSLPVSIPSQWEQQVNSEQVL
jgi:hypothetical protein